MNFCQAIIWIDGICCPSLQKLIFSIDTHEPTTTVLCDEEVECFMDPEVGYLMDDADDEELRPYCYGEDPREVTVRRVLPANRFVDSDDFLVGEVCEVVVYDSPF